MNTIMEVFSDIYGEEFCEKSVDMPMTLTEKRWLRAILEDSKIELFLSNDFKEIIEDELDGIDTLYRNSAFKYYDKNISGDDFDDEDYKGIFKQLIEAIKEKKILKIEYCSRNGNMLTEEYLPYKMEYSKNEDRFRVLAFLIHDNEPSLAYKISLARINNIIDTNKEYIENINVEALINARLNAQPITLFINEKDSLYEEFVREYGTPNVGYEKCTDNMMKVTIHYDKQDEHDMLMSLLAYGTSIKIVGHESFLDLYKKRIKKQYTLLYGK